jgi:hypothetical protein
MNPTQMAKPDTGYVLNDLNKDAVNGAEPNGDVLY